MPLMARMSDRGIGSLAQRIDELDSDLHALWDRIYEMSTQEGHLILPDSLRAQGETYDSFLRQQIIRVTNRITGETTLFNELRAHRPIEAHLGEKTLLEIEATSRCPFCHPREMTPSDTFGRIEGRYSLTASNLAKYDALHALIVFREHEPFVTEEEPIRDFIEVAAQWYAQAHRQDPRARYPFFMWNCLWRAGASMVHGHAQVLLSLRPYRGVREWLGAKDAYRNQYGSSYEDDLFRLYQDLGLGTSYPSGKILVHLTPVKEREVLIQAPSASHLPPLLSRVLSRFQRLGIQSFNVAILQPPLGDSSPVLARVVDRGDLLSRSSDIGGMELYGRTAVVSSDPFILADSLFNE